MGKPLMSGWPLELLLPDTDRPLLLLPRLRLMDRARLTRWRTAPWTAWPMPATTSTGVPRARAQGLQGERMLAKGVQRCGHMPTQPPQIEKGTATYGFFCPLRLLKLLSMMPKMAMTEPTCIMVQVDQYSGIRSSPSQNCSAMSAYTSMTTDTTDTAP